MIDLAQVSDGFRLKWAAAFDNGLENHRLVADQHEHLVDTIYEGRNWTWKKGWQGRTNASTDWATGASPSAL